MSGESEHFKKGLAVRRDVLGKDYVDGSIAKADDFMMAFQEITTEWCWGYAWTRPGLDRKTRSMLNLAMLTALKAPNEIKLHVKGALTNGVTVDEIKEEFRSMVSAGPVAVGKAYPDAAALMWALGEGSSDVLDEDTDHAEQPSNREERSRIRRFLNVIQGK